MLNGPRTQGPAPGGGSHPKALPAGINMEDLVQDHVEAIPGTHDEGNPDMESEFFDTRQARATLLPRLCGCPIHVSGQLPVAATHMSAMHV